MRCAPHDPYVYCDWEHTAAIPRDRCHLGAVLEIAVAGLRSSQDVSTAERGPMPPKHSHKASNRTSSSKKSAPPTLRDLFGAGSAIRATWADVEEVGPDYLEAVIQSLNQQFGLTLHLTDDVYQLIKNRLRVVAGGVEANAELVTRREIEARLKKLKGHVGGTIELLNPARLGLVQRGEFELIMLLSEVMGERHRG